MEIVLVDKYRKIEKTCDKLCPNGTLRVQWYVVSAKASGNISNTKDAKGRKNGGGKEWKQYFPYIIKTKFDDYL